MSETPKLVWQTSFGATRPDGVTANRVPFDHQKATVESVVVWLREQGAGEVKPSARTENMHAEGRTRFVYSGDVLLVEPGRYLVIPLDTEPPKEDGE